MALGEEASMESGVSLPEVKRLSVCLEKVTLGTSIRMKIIPNSQNCLRIKLVNTHTGLGLVLSR